MKSSSLLSLFVGFVLLGGCASNSTSPNNSANFSADVNGIRWLPSSTVYGIRDSAATMYWIDARNANGDEFSIFLDSTKLKVGTYTPKTAFAGFTHHDPKNFWYNSYSGTLNITEISPSHISGTFQFKGASQWLPDTINVTNGQFDVKVTIGLIPF